MSEKQWRRELAKLNRGAVKARENLVSCRGNLAEKIELKRAVKAADEAIRQHKLNYYELTGA